MGQRIQEALADIDPRADAALVAELEHTTIADLVRSTDAAALPLSAERQAGAGRGMALSGA